MTRQVSAKALCEFAQIERLHDIIDTTDSGMSCEQGKLGGTSASQPVLASSLCQGEEPEASLQKTSPAGSSVVSGPASVP